MGEEVNEIRWIKIGSWHIIGETWVDQANNTDVVMTLCGYQRMWDGTFATTFPPTEKSCESCLRLAAKK